MKNAIAHGDVFTATAPSGGVTSGQAFLLGAILVVAVAAAAEGALVAVNTEGVYEVTKLTADTPAQGAALYWDDTNKRLTTTASGNTYAGVAYEAAGGSATTVKIKLKGA